MNHSSHGAGSHVICQVEQTTSFWNFDGHSDRGQQGERAIWLTPVRTDVNERLPPQVKGQVPGIRRE